MPRQQRYFSDYGRGGYSQQQRRGANVVPYLVIAVLAVIGLLLARTSPPTAAIQFNGRVLDSYTNSPIAGARVQVLAAGPEHLPAVADAPIATTLSATVAGISTTTQALALPPAVLTTTSAVDGGFLLPNLPDANAVLSIQQPGYAPQQARAAGRTSLDIRLVPDTLHGTISDKDGHPVISATVAVGGAVTSSGADGSYMVSGVGSDHKLLVKAPGYRVARSEFGSTTQQSVTLEPFSARAVYVNADTIASNGKFFGLIRLANDSEINAMVIDVKADTTGYVLYNSALPQVQAAGAVNPIIGDLRDLIATLHKNNIYVIARQALFWDEKLVAAHPEWAIRSKSTAGPWADAYGHHWANPHRPEVWAYNIAIAKEVAALGADEIQFDYVRFPSDGNLADTDYGVPADQTRAAAISGFLTQAQAALSPQGVFIAADVFGLSPIVKDDLGIGQQFDQLVQHLDYICPMAYPSHYADGFLDFPKPAEHPSEVVGYTLQAAQAKMLRSNARLRPWLQDFTLGGVSYDASRVRGQIEVSEQDHTAGWMLWNFDNVYTTDALKKP